MQSGAQLANFVGGDVRVGDGGGVAPRPTRMGGLVWGQARRKKKNKGGK